MGLGFPAVEYSPCPGYAVLTWQVQLVLSSCAQTTGNWRNWVSRSFQRAWNGHMLCEKVGATRMFVEELEGRHVVNES